MVPRVAVFLPALASCYSPELREPDAPPACEASPAQADCTLVDDFDDGQVDPRRWAAWASGASYREEDCALVLDLGPRSSAPVTIAGVASLTYHDLTGMRWSAEVLEVTAPVAGPETFLLAGPDLQNRVAIRQAMGTLQARVRVADLTTVEAELTYDPAMHRFWGIAVDVGEVSFETSQDGVSWTSFARAVPPLGLTAAQVDLEAETYTEVVDPGAARFGSARVCPVGD